MLGLIDIFLVIMVVLSVLFALYRGLVRELLGIVAWLLAGFAALYGYGLMQPIMGLMIENKRAAGITGSLIIALVVLVIMTLINAWITKHLRKSALSGLDRILGFVFGIFRAGLLAAVVYLGASMVLSEEQLETVEEQNFSVPYIRQMAEKLEYVIPENVKNDLKSYEQGKLKSEHIEKIGIDLKKAVKKELSEYEEKDKQSLDEKIIEISQE